MALNIDLSLVVILSAIMLLYKVKEVKSKNAELAGKDKVTEKIKAQTCKEKNKNRVVDITSDLALNRLFKPKEQMVLSTVVDGEVEYLSSGSTRIMSQSI